MMKISNWKIEIITKYAVFTQNKNLLKLKYLSDNRLESQFSINIHAFPPKMIHYFYVAEITIFLSPVEMNLPHNVFCR